MGFQGYVTRILFIVLVAIAFNYRNQIMEVVNQTFGKEKSGEEHSTKEHEAKTSPRGPIKAPDPDLYNPPFDPSNPPDPILTKSGARMVTKNELAAHGHSGPLKPIWLAMLGKVFDVDKGAEHYYGPDGGYNFFTGMYKVGKGSPWSCIQCKCMHAVKPPK